MKVTKKSLLSLGLGFVLAASLAACKAEEKTEEGASPAPGASAESPAQGQVEEGEEGDVAVGKALYETNCASCHMANGEGVAGTFPPLAGSERVNGPAAEHIKVVLNGLSGPITVKGETYNGFMTPFMHLSDEEIANIVTYERTAWGNTGGAVTAEQVRALRP